MNEEIKEHTQTLQPFTKLCMTIGQLPASYVESMSYYEQLIWFTKYLQDQVIPAVNQNAAAVEELQGYYIELQNYVNHYFDNLDVQEEINNKLNQMAIDGTLYNIINQDIFNNLNSAILENANNISIINNNIPSFITSDSTSSVSMSMLSQEVREALTGGSTAVVSDNSITNHNLQDGIVSIDKMDQYLQNNLDKNLQVVSADYSNVGYAYIDSDEIVYSTDNQYRYAIVNLTKDKEYVFTGYNFYATLGCIIIDNEDNILASTIDSSLSSGLRSVSLTYRPLTNNTKAILSEGYTIGSYTSFVRQNQKLMEVKNISLNYKAQSTNLIEEINDYLGSRTSTIGSVIKAASASNYKISIYKMNKGTTYDINSFNHYDVAGLIITDKDMKVTYSSSSSSTTPKTAISYNFTATIDGYIYLTSDATTTSTIQIINDLVESKYTNKKWSILGDSISDPTTLGDDKMYADYIHDDIGINIQNLAKSGAGYWKRNIYDEAFYQQALSIDIDSDVVTLLGSWNDLGTQGGTTGTQIIGNITDTGTDTICGCINTTFDNIFATCPNAVVGVILPTPWYNHHGYSYTYDDDYIDAIKGICIARSIPVLDLYTQSNLMPWNETFNGLYFLNSDGTHPNTEGQKRISGMIEEFVKSLLI